MPQQLDPQSLRTPRVLIVEDEARLRELLLDVIPEMGFRASASRSAEGATEMMAGDPREIMILDLHLPGQQGIDFFREVRRRWPATQVIILTAFGDFATATDAIRLDVSDFLTKPCHLSEVEVALDRARRRLVTAFTPAGSSRRQREASDSDRPATLHELEKQQIIEALNRNHGNRTRAAAELGISRRTLHYRLRSYSGESGELL
jgi:DNA-binding NtrC family response regulator